VTQLRRWLAPVRGIDYALATYALAFLAWTAVRTPGTPSAKLIGEAVFVPLGPLVAWAFWRNSRLAGMDTRSRWGWLLLALSAAMLAASGTAWSICLRLGWERNWPAWVDGLETADTVLAIAGIVMFPGRSFKGRDRTRFLLDVGLIVVAGLVLAIYFGLRLYFQDLKDESAWGAASNNGFDWAVFALAGVGSVQKRDRSTRLALSLLVASATSYVVANYYFTVASATSSYHPGDTVDVFWFGAWVIRWGAARVASCTWTIDATATARATATGETRYESGAFSYVVVACCFGLLTSQVFSKDELFVGVLAGYSALAVGLLLARQLVELRETRRLFDEQLAQDAWFRSLIQHSSDTVLIVDSDGVITFTSTTTSRVFGEDSPVRVGGRVEDLVRPDDLEVLAPVLAGRGGARRLQVHVRNGAGSWREVEALWTDRRADPAVQGIVVNCRDVTDRNELERQLRHAQKLDAVGQLAGGLAHDLNNALAIIRGYTELLRTDFAADSPAGEDLSHVQAAVDRAAAITRKVLAFSRRQAAERTALDLNDVVRDLAPMLRQSVTGRVDVRLRLEAGLWPVLSDHGQIEQVLVNLATNARDAMPTGGVLTIATANRHVATISPATAGFPPGDYVSLAVADDGLGMTPNVREHIFEPFFSTKSEVGGTGLGLAMVHGLVAESGGRIVVDSAPTCGSVFTILLPRTHAAAVSADTPGGPGGRLARPHTILVVDDEKDVRTVARRILQRQGYEVIEAKGGAEALDLIGRPDLRIDLLLTDLVMPGMHGRELVARAAGLRPELPVVCMTGFPGDNDDATRPGKDRLVLLAKPFSSGALDRAVEEAASRRGAS
jgi:two-component system, cell cycle sensor histidine kinase and response regulator CckA